MKLKEILKIIGLLGILQLLRLGIKQFLFLFINRTNFSDHLASMAAMSLLIIMILEVSKRRKISLSIFPVKFDRSYIVVTIIFVLLLVSTPSNYTEGIQAIILLGYSSLITPIFEELLFRGYVWNRLSVIFKCGPSVYLWSSFLFGIWHLGYFDSLAFRVETDLVQALIWKMITGLLRWKTRNCFSTMLLHGAMNIFGR